MRLTRLGALLLQLGVLLLLGIGLVDGLYAFSHPEPRLLSQAPPQEVQTQNINDCNFLLSEYLNDSQYYKGLSMDEQIKNLSNSGWDAQVTGLYQPAYCLYERLLTLTRSQAKELDRDNRDQVQLRRFDALYGMGNAQLKMGKYSEALKSYRQALATAQQIRNSMGLLMQAKVLGGLGDISLAFSDYEEAQKYNQQRLGIGYQAQIQEEWNNGVSLQLNEVKRSIGSTLGSLGIIFYSMGRTTKQTEYYDQAINYLQKYQEMFEDEQKKALAELGLAKVYTAKKDFEKAEENLKKVDRRLKSIIEKKDADLPQYIQDRMNWAEEKRWHEIRKDYYSFATEFALDRGAYEEAESNVKEFKALAQREPGQYMDPTYIRFLKVTEQTEGNEQKVQIDQQALSDAHNLNGLVLFKRSMPSKDSGNNQANLLESSRQEFQKSVEYRRKLLQQPLSDTLKVFFFDTQRNAYLNLQQVLIKQGKTEEALIYSEQSRTQVLAELLGDIEFKGISIEQIKKIAEKQKATIVEYSLIENPIEGGQAQLLTWIVTPQGEIKHIRQPVGTELKKWEAVSASDDDRGRYTVSWPRGVRRLIGAENDGDRGRITVKWSHDYRLPFNTAWLEQPAIANSPEQKAPTEQEKEAHRDKQAQALKDAYKILIQPISSLLPSASSSDAPKIIFIPDGGLFLIPFAALQDESGKYLIENYTTLTAPSIQVLEQIYAHQDRRDQQEGNDKGLRGRLNNQKALVVGNPIMPPLECAGDTQLMPLKGAEQEAEEIAKKLGTQPLIGADATEERVRVELSKARFVHLATHSLLDNCTSWSIPGGIALTSSGYTDSTDGWLTASEIVNMSQLSADLVVLSACDTGQGRLTGDGVIGLSRSFIKVGVPSVIVTLWSIPDAPSANLMAKFYEELKRSHDKAAALRQAMLETKKNNPDPLNWAAFTLIGASN